MTAISLAGAAGYLPDTIVDNSFFGVDEKAATGGMFKGSRLRRHVAAGETGASMIEKASRTLQGRLGFSFEKEVDLILTNVSCPDSPFTGCGASVARQLGCKPKWVLDLHNTGCVAFVYMLGVARELMASGAIKSALLCCANFDAFLIRGGLDQPPCVVLGRGRKAVVRRLRVYGFITDAEATRLRHSVAGIADCPRRRVRLAWWCSGGRCQGDA